MAHGSGGDWAALARDAALREPAVLSGGPRHGRWYWRDWLEEQQEAGRRLEGLGQPSSSWCCYTVTDRREAHRECPVVEGRVFEWQEPAPAVAAAVPVPAHVESPVVCVECGQRLLLVRPGRVRCEACRVAEVRRLGGRDVA